MPITTNCTCGQMISVPDQAAGLSAKCPTCGGIVKVPGDVKPAQVIGGVPQQQSDDSGAMGWVWFILIFGVGNFILYKTTGIFLIPLPRR